MLGPEYSTDQKYIFKKVLFWYKEKKKEEGRAQHQNQFKETNPFVWYQET